MRLCSVTLMGGAGRGEPAISAIESAKFVDACILIDTCPSATVNIALVKAAAKPDWPELIVVEYPERDKPWDCATGRNFGLDISHQLGFDWAITLDTDEELQLNGFDLRAHLEATPFNTIQVWNTFHSYTKERCIRLPSASRFTGRVHEEYVGPGVVREALEQPRFYERPKTKEEQDALYAAVERLSREWLRDEPDALRPRYYLGDAYAYFGNHHAAIPHLFAYAMGTPEETEYGWTMFRIAKCCDAIGLHDMAVDVCVDAMKRVPYMVELHAWAGYQEMRQDHLLGALAWSDAAIVLGRTLDFPRLRPVRLGFQMLEAEHELPWEVRRNCYGAAAATARANGDEHGAASLQAMADSADEMARKATKTREATEGTT